MVLITTKNPTKGKTSITYLTNFAIRKPIAVPDLVTDGYTFAKMFAESFTTGRFISPAVNKTLKFSQAYLDAFKAKSIRLPNDKVEIDPVTGEYVYYEAPIKYKELYKKTTLGIGK